MRSSTTHWMVVLAAALTFALGWVAGPGDNCLEPIRLQLQTAAIRDWLDDALGTLEMIFLWIAGHIQTP